MTDDIQPFDEIRMLFVNLPAPDLRAVAAVRARDAQLTKPPGALGRLEDIVEWLAAWPGQKGADAPPQIETCNQEEARHERARFDPGETVYFVSYFRDQLDTQTSTPCSSASGPR